MSGKRRHCSLPLKNGSSGGSSFAEGARLCEDAARSGVGILRCFFTAQAQRKYARYSRAGVVRRRGVLPGG